MFYFEVRNLYKNSMPLWFTRIMRYRLSYTGGEAGADTGIPSGGCEILKRENYMKGKKGRLSIKTTFLK